MADAETNAKEAAMAVAAEAAAKAKAKAAAKAAAAAAAAEKAAAAKAAAEKAAPAKAAALGLLQPLEALSLGPDTLRTAMAAAVAYCDAQGAGSVADLVERANVALRSLHVARGSLRPMQAGLEGGCDLLDGLMAALALKPVQAKAFSASLKGPAAAAQVCRACLRPVHPLSRNPSAPELPTPSVAARAGKGKGCG
eukprot:scaffold48791_cov59-Phaeocystis_antarctica.AAC.5